MVDINNYLKTWSDKLSLPLTEIESEFNKILEEEKAIHKDLTDEQQRDRALKRLALTYKKQLRSPAVGFEGILIGASDCVDMVAKTRREAKELFKNDPQSAVAQGVTNEEGEPLDIKQEWNSGKTNPRYGKPLPEHNFIRNLFGIAVKTNCQDTPKVFSMAVTGEKAEKEDLPIFRPVKFMAIDRTPPEIGEKAYKLNASQFTNFVINEDIKLPKYDELIKQCCGDSIVELKNVNEYHLSVKDDYNRLAIIIGDVSSLNLEPTSVGSRIMVIEDINSSLDDLDAKGMTCWVPPRSNVDFAEGSKVIAIGRTAQGKLRDEAGNPTEELGDVTLNVYGLYPMPEYKIALPQEIAEITEDSLNTK